MKPTFRLFRVRGVPVGAHWTWLVAFAVVAWALAASVFPSAYPHLGGHDHVLMALAAAGLLFASVVLHELAHAVAARREGMPVEGITLWLLGGVSDAGDRARSAGQELRVAASGPVVSVALAALSAAASAGARGLGWPQAVHGVLEYVARLNLVVAAFNLVPALPLDGGRILRAWLWRRQRDLLAATRSGARAGQAFGLTLLVVGVLNLWSGARALGIWLAVLGVFLVRAASSELADTRTRHRLRGLTAGDVMASDPGVVLNDTPVARLVESPPAPERSGYPVLGGGRLLGVVALASVRGLPSTERADRLVEDVMTPLDDIPMVDAADPVLDVLDRLDGGNPIGQVVVLADGCVVGILDEGDVAHALDRTTSGPAGDGGPGDRGAKDRLGRRRRAGTRAWVLVATLCVVTGGALYRPPYVVVGPGPVVDVTGDVTVAGIPVTPIHGRYLATGVEVRRTSALGTLVAALRDGRRVMPVARATDDPNTAGGGSRRPGLSRETRSLAAVAAASSQGLPTRVAGTGARVVAVRHGSPAAGRLRAGDVIVAADGQPVTLAGHLAQAVRGLPTAPATAARTGIGTGVRLSVERSGQRRDVVVTLGGGGLGVTVETRDLAVDLPFEVRFSGGAAGGEGAGLAYALAIADLISTRDLAQGRTVAAAGTTDADGRVGPVGAMPAQADAAAGAGAALLVVAADDAGAARHDGLQVEGVDSLARALEALSTTV
jgi:PDZ domain-containing secreted protein/Zn-dependent protease/predicted transcriptional regulator